MALKASGLDYRALAAYFVDGVTWTRLRALAVQRNELGGLQLFGDGTKACKKIFGTSPSAIVLTRPETDLNFLRFLAGKEHILHRLATVDLEQRPSLAQDVVIAVNNLGDISKRIQRSILCEILERCMYLAHYSGKHPMVADSTSWDALLCQASFTIMDLELTPVVLQRLQSTDEDSHTYYMYIYRYYYCLFSIDSFDLKHALCLQTSFVFSKGFKTPVGI
jgi:hypothetical protein